jgi:hypothetical protein
MRLALQQLPPPSPSGRSAQSRSSLRGARNTTRRGTRVVSVHVLAARAVGWAVGGGGSGPIVRSARLAPHLRNRYTLPVSFLLPAKQPERDTHPMDWQVRARQQKQYTPKNPESENRPKILECVPSVPGTTLLAAPLPGVRGGGSRRSIHLSPTRAARHRLRCSPPSPICTV